MSFSCENRFLFLRQSSFGFSVLWDSPIVRSLLALLDWSSKFLTSLLVSVLSLFSLYSLFLPVCLGLSLWCLILSLNVYRSLGGYSRISHSEAPWIPGGQAGACWPVNFMGKWSGPHRSFTWDPQMPVCKMAYPWGFFPGETKIYGSGYTLPMFLRWRKRSRVLCYVGFHQIACFQPWASPPPTKMKYNSSQAETVCMSLIPALHTLFLNSFSGSIPT